ncbi:DUF456 domain-containing protein [Pseudonocardia sp. N23]|uniref:DUF456 domain-containing protein n=1 Tax=Pseudonocardia sp. N23 TaxID=1987376 RepID=UPI000BFE05EA|nr:DUF456 domain-containing protein [Pseudonocardia sp. N23]GAY09403.1 hypothetical protein TOK_3382 [Pseudonocardia sp. N23]
MTAVLAGLIIALGLVGIVSLVLPGLIVVLAGVAVWAIPRGDAVGWWVLAVASALVIVGTVAKYLLPGRKLKDAGVPGRTLMAGAGLGVVGFFVVPVIGLFLGFVLGVWLAELARLPDRGQAWTSAKAALRAVGFSMLIELAAGLLATAAWIVGMFVG